MIDLDRLTTQAQDAFVDAQAILKRYEQNQLDNEHVLLAMLENEKGLVPKMLHQLNVDPKVVRQELEAALAKRPRATVSSMESGQVYITPRLKKLLDEAVGISSAHRQQLLLSLIGREGAPGAQPAALARYGQTFEIRLTGFAKQEIAQEFLDSDQIKVKLHAFLALQRGAPHSLAPVSAAGRHGGR